jgi:hypothetical protein
MKKFNTIVKEIVRTAYAFGVGLFVYYVLWDCTSWFCCDMWWPFPLMSMGTYWAFMACRNKLRDEIVKKTFNEYLPRLIDLLERAVEIEEKDEVA